MARRESMKWHHGRVETLWEPLPGGWSQESFLTGVGDDLSVVRICARPGPRGAAVAQVDASLMHLVRGLVPVPEVLEVRAAVADAPALLVTRYVPGIRGEVVLREGSAEQRRALGLQLGRVAGTLAGLATLRPGHFVDEDLRIGGERGDDLLAHVEERLPLLRGFDRASADRLRALARAAQEVLDEVGRSCVVHGDLHPRNVVLDPDTRDVRAVVDWEHAHSGFPHADLGALLRFDRAPGWVEAVLAGWSAVRGEEPGLALERARTADLVALVDLAARPAGNLVVDLAHCFLGEIVRTGDLHAWP